jgi:hypothetical protein
MPRLNPTFARSVCFLYGTDPETGKKGGPWGTGFVVGFPFARAEHFYAVTCQHNINGHCHDVRLNTRDGKSRFIRRHLDDWQHATNGYDISAVDITDDLSLKNDEVSYLPIGVFLTKDFRDAVELSIGEDGFILGLFANLSGEIRNLVSARFGNVSLLPSKNDPVEQGNKVSRPSYLFDIRSRTGYSGSPVFVYRTPANDLRDITYGPHFVRDLVPRVARNSGDSATHLFDKMSQHKEIQDNMFLRVLGIHSSQYHDIIEARTIRKDKKPGRKMLLQSPNSMCVVTPSWEILDLLNNNPNFTKQRKRREQMRDENKSSHFTVPQTATDETTAVPDGDEGSQERFTSLVGAAARKRPRAGQTSRDATRGSSGGKKTR